ncbi:MAG: SPOR domain-containing protein, partial [Armatimonadota bacterium]|nr:SPOR domain-containing protein [Armatimonadota bacterium]
MRGSSRRQPKLGVIAAWFAACVACFLAGMLWIGPRWYNRGGDEAATVPEVGAPESGNEYRASTAAPKPVAPPAERPARREAPVVQPAVPAPAPADDASRRPESAAAPTSSEGGARVQIRPEASQPRTASSDRPGAGGSEGAALQGTRPETGSAGVTVIPLPRRPGAEGGGAPSAPGPTGAAADENTAAAGQAAPPGQERSTAPPAPTVQRTMLYRVEVGAPETQEEAEQLAAELKKAGIAARTVVKGSIFSVQAGAFRNRSNAERLA